LWLREQLTQDGSERLERVTMRDPSTEFAVVAKRRSDLFRHWLLGFTAIRVELPTDSTGLKGSVPVFGHNRHNNTRRARPGDASGGCSPGIPRIGQRSHG